jgi:cytochrome c
MASLNTSPVKEIVMKGFFKGIEYKSLFLVVGTFFVLSYAEANEALLKKNNCMACHAVDKKLVGPSYKAVADRYRGQADAADKLAKKIRAGGAGVWGPMPMPPHPQVSEADAKTMATYILNTK